VIWASGRYIFVTWRLATLCGLLLAVLVLGGGSASAHKRLPTCPQTLRPSGKGYEPSSAKEEARTAEITAETYATDHNGLYSGLTPRKLHRYEPSLSLTVREAEREGGNAYLSSARPISHGAGYIVRVQAADGERFAIMREADGEIQRTGWVHGTHCAW